MKTPAFFDAVPAITVADPLAETLGVAEGRVRERLADHVARAIAGSQVGVVDLDRAGPRGGGAGGQPASGA